MLCLLCGHCLCQSYPQGHGSPKGRRAESYHLVLPGLCVRNGPSRHGAPSFTWHIPVVHNPSSQKNLPQFVWLSSWTCSDLARRGACWAPGMFGWLQVTPLPPGELSRHFPWLWFFTCSFCLQCPSVVQTGDIQGFVSCCLGRRVPGYPVWGPVRPISRGGQCAEVCVGGGSPALAQPYLVFVLSDGEVPALDVVPIYRTCSAFSVAPLRAA